MSVMQNHATMAPVTMVWMNTHVTATHITPEQIVIQVAKFKHYIYYWYNT